MTYIRSLAFAGLTLIVSAGAAFAAPYSYQALPDQYQSTYHGQNVAYPGFATSGAYEIFGPYDFSCTRGTLPWIVHSCGSN